MWAFAGFVAIQLLSVVIEVKAEAEMLVKWCLTVALLVPQAREMLVKELMRRRKRRE